MINSIKGPFGLVLICFMSFLTSGCMIAEFFEEESSSEDGTVTDNCGAEETACPAPENATASCVSSQCAWECDEGFHVNDARDPSGCLADDTVNSCTPAGVDCRAAAPSNSTATCDGVSCGFECNDGFDLTANGVCQRQCQSDEECPVFSFGCINGDCKSPTDTCDGQDEFSQCFGPNDATGQAMVGYCVTNPATSTRICVNSCDPSIGCNEASSVCQPLGAVEDIENTENVPALCKTACASDAECPAGTFGCENGVCVSPFGGGGTCENIGDICATPGGTEGRCFSAGGDPLCLAVCDPVGEVACATPGSVCQASGIIGDPTTYGVCIPPGQIPDVAFCPTGTLGLYDGSCVPPSAIACDGVEMNGACSFSYFGSDHYGYCYGADEASKVCLASCDVESGIACENPNNVCQPAGIIGDPSTVQVCIPNNILLGDEDCPTGTHGFYDGACVPPSVIPCLNADDPSDFTSTLGDACEFGYFGATLTGACYGDGTSPAACLAECSPSGAAGDEEIGCQNPNSICQAIGLVGDPATVTVCIPSNLGCLEDSQCPSGTHRCIEGACVPPSIYPCLDEENPGNYATKLGQACEFTYLGSEVTGSCFGTGQEPAACLANCDPSPFDGSAPIACANSNNICQATGAVGDAATVNVCIPDTLGCQVDSDCPSGSLFCDKGGCVTPSAVACVSPDDPNDFTATIGQDCGFLFNDTEVSGICFGTGTTPPACLAACDLAPADGSDPTPCAVASNICQASGPIGDPATVQICIPNTVGCSEDSDCPTGTFGCTEGSCIAPSALPCANPDDPEDFTSKLGESCTFDYGGVSYDGACFGTGASPAVCLDTCNPSPLDGSEGTGCANANNICQSTGLVGDPSTVHVCIPTSAGCEEASDCPSGSFVCHDGACVPPSVGPCVNPADPTDFTSMIGSDCGFDYLDVSVAGKCFGTGTTPAACLDTCDPVNNVGCFNSGSVCQASGITGDPTTVNVCIPASSGCTVDSDCPTGTHGCIDGACAAPSVTPCLDSADPSDFTVMIGYDCSFEYMGGTFGGTCYG
ncbi:MAG: hypothetical protein HOK97_08990, partial [Deltaproteobacteria bacterium]|nr:hypothetical protein [Deltaproteobacteria bacterium]